MAEPITIPLSTYQQRRFAYLRAQAAEAEHRQNEAVTAIVGHVHAEAVTDGWSIALSDDAITCTPKAAE